MSGRRFAFRMAALGLSCVCLVVVSAQQLPSSRRELWVSDVKAQQQALAKKDIPAYREAVAKAHRDFPGNTRLLHELAVAEVLTGNVDQGLKDLNQFLAAGLLPRMQSAGIKKLQEMGKLPDFEANKKEVSSSTPLFRLADPDLIAEDIAYDSVGKLFFISSVRKRKILRCDADGKCADFITSSAANPFYAILALSVDAKHKMLWATTAGMNAMEGFQPSDDGKSAVLRFDLLSGKLLKRYEPQDGAKHALGDMTVSPAGDAYISDGLSGDVFVIDAKKDTLEPLLPNGNFVSPQTPALDSDGRILYVADYAQGIAAVNLANKSVTWLTAKVPTATPGCDGLYLMPRLGLRLICVQNGTSPERITMFHLSSPTEIGNWRVLEANWPGLGDPTHGVLVGQDFYFIANSGWDRLDEETGALKPGQPAEVRKVVWPDTRLR